MNKFYNLGPVLLYDVYQYSYPSSIINAAGVWGGRGGGVQNLLTQKTFSCPSISTVTSSAVDGQAHVPS